MNTLQALYELGQYHEDHKFFQTIKASLLILGKKPKILADAFNSEVPLDVDRTNEVNPNYGYDSLKAMTTFSKTPEKSKADAFWDLQLELFPQHKALLQETRRALQKGPPTVEGKAKSDWVVLALQDGTPLVANKAFRKWWKKNRVEKVIDVLPMTASCWLTGVTCHPRKLHPKVKGVPGTGGKATLLSYDKKVYEFRGRDQGENFPISADAGETYATGLRYALEGVPGRRFRYGFTVSENLSMLLIPEGRADSDYVLAIMPFLESFSTKEAIQELWANFESLKPAQESVHVILLKGSQGRVAVLKHTLMTEQQLHESLLRLKRAFHGSLTLRWAVSGDNSVLPEQYRGDVAWNVLVMASLPKPITDEILRTYDPDNFLSEVWLTYNYEDSNHMPKQLPKADIVQTCLNEFDEKHFNQSTAFAVGRLAAIMAAAFKSYHHIMHSDKKVEDRAYLGMALDDPLKLIENLRRTQLYLDALRRKGMITWDTMLLHLQDRINSEDVQRWAPEQRRDISLGFYAQRSLNSRALSALSKRAAEKQDSKDTETPKDSEASAA